MPAIKQGQQLGKNDLNAFFYSGGKLSDPYSVTYTLYDATTGINQLIGMANRTPIKVDIGNFYAPWTVQSDEPTGLHKIEWKYLDTATSEEKIKIEEFDVLPFTKSKIKRY